MSSIHISTKIILFHYSNKKPILGNVVENNEEGVVVELPLRNLKGYVNDGDPLVVIYNSDSSIYMIKSCYAICVYVDRSAVYVKIDKELKSRNRRLYERLPVSIYADIKDVELKKRHSGILHNISKNGLLLCSKEILQINNHFEINVFFENMIIFLRANVVRKEEKPYYNCYGLYVPSEDAISLNSLYKCFKKTCEEYTKSLAQGYNIFIDLEHFEYPNINRNENVEQTLNNSLMKLDMVLKRSRN